MAEGGNRPEYVGREHPCKLCYVRAVTRRALITHYLRKHGKGLDYGSDWPRDLEEDDYQKRMMKLKRGQKNSYDKRHGRTGDLAADQAPPGEEVVSDQSSGPVPCQVFMNVTQKPYQMVFSHSV